MKLGKEVGLGPGHIVLDGPPKGHSPQFSVHVYCGQTVANVSYMLGLGFGWAQGIVLDGGPQLVLRDVAMAANYGTEIAITGFM